MRELNTRELEAVAGGWFLGCFSWIWSCKPKACTPPPCNPCEPKKDDCKPSTPPPN